MKVQEQTEGLKEVISFEFLPTLDIFVKVYKESHSMFYAFFVNEDGDIIQEAHFQANDLYPNDNFKEKLSDCLQKYRARILRDIADEIFEE